MGLFGKKDITAETEAARLLKELQQIQTRLDAVVSQLSGRADEVKITREIETLKRDLVEKQIQFDREKEKWEREKRETEHMVGLQKKRAEQERDLAVQAAELEVREGNLKAKEDMFEERLTKITEGLENQVKYLREDIIKQLLERLPTFDVKTTLDPHRMLNSGNGGGSTILDE